MVDETAPIQNEAEEDLFAEPHQYEF